MFSRSCNKSLKIVLDSAPVRNPVLPIQFRPNCFGLLCTCFPV